MRGLVDRRFQHYFHTVFLPNKGWKKIAYTLMFSSEDPKRLVIPSKQACGLEYDRRKVDRYYDTSRVLRAAIGPRNVNRYLSRAANDRRNFDSYSLRFLGSAQSITDGTSKTTSRLSCAFSNRRNVNRYAPCFLAVSNRRNANGYISLFVCSQLPTEPLRLGFLMQPINH